MTTSALHLPQRLVDLDIAFSDTGSAELVRDMILTSSTTLKFIQLKVLKLDRFRQQQQLAYTPGTSGLELAFSRLEMLKSLEIDAYTLSETPTSIFYTLEPLLALRTLSIHLDATLGFTFRVDDLSNFLNFGSGVVVLNISEPRADPW